MTGPTASTELVITRTFDAQREQVYQAFTDPDQIARWFGPAGYSVPRDSVEIDARAGGRQRLVMVSDADPQMTSVVYVTFTDVIENELLAGTEIRPGALPNGRDPAGMYLRLNFTDEAGRTRLALRQGPYTERTADIARLSWNSSFSKLDLLLGGLMPGQASWRSGAARQGGTGGTGGTGGGTGGTSGAGRAGTGSPGPAGRGWPGGRRFWRAACTALAGLALAAGLTPAVAGAPPAAAGATAAAANAASCSVTWGSTVKHAGTMQRSRVLGVRAGRHACFDRLVVDIGRGARPGYRVQYVRKLVQDPSGKVIHVRGGARLRITVLAPAGAGFHPASRHLVSVAGFATFRQVVGAGSFEGVTSVGLGVRARLPFRVFALGGPGHHSRLVIDVAHHW